MELTKTKAYKSKLAFATYIVCTTLTVVTIILSIIFGVINNKIPDMVDRILTCVLAIAVFNIPLFVGRKLKWDVPAFLQIIVLLFALSHFVFGEIVGVYGMSLLFDKVLHTISGVIAGIFGFSLVYALNARKEGPRTFSPFFVALFAFCFALAVGYVWELFEFSLDSLFGTNCQRWMDDFKEVIIDGEKVMVQNWGQGHGLIDTMMDMVVNSIGALSICIVGFIFLKKGKNGVNSWLVTTPKTRESSNASQDSL